MTQKLKSIDKKLAVVVPLELIDYLCNDYAYRNPNRYSKLEAFRNLVMLHCSAKEKGSEKMNASIAQLSKAWNWSRPTVSAFVNDLAVLDILDVETTATSKAISLKSSIVRGAALT